MERRDTDNPAPAAVPAGAPRGGRKRRRGLRRALIALGLALGIVAIATLTPLAGLYLRPLAAPHLRGMRLEGGSMRFTLGGDLIISDASIVIEPGAESDLRGEATRFLRVERMRIGLSLLAPITGADFIYDVTVSDAEVLIAKPVDGYAINVLEIFDDAAPAGPLRIPGIQVRRATLTLGEYDSEGNVEPLRVMRVAAGVRRAGEDRYAIWLREVDEGASAAVLTPVEFEGAIDASAPQAKMFTGALAGVNFADWPPESIPAQLRHDYRRFAPSGSLRSASFEYDEGAGAFRLTLDVAGRRPGEAPVRFTMPLGSREDGKPDLIVPVEATGQVGAVWRDTGVTWEQAHAAPAPGPADHRWSLVSELSGSLLGAPCAVEIGYWFGGDELAYYDVEATSTAPVPLDPERWVGRVPEAILDEIRRFDIDGVGDVWLRAGRDAETPEFVETGLAIHDTRAIYHNFQYPIEQVRGDINFRNGDVRIALTGETPSGTPVRIDGDMRIGDAITMDLVAAGKGVPYDDAMAAALNHRSEHIVDLLLYEEGLEAWRERGLLTDPFEVGGSADVDVHLTLDTAESSEVGVTIDIRSERIGVRNRHFPLPAIGRNVHVQAIKELRRTLPDGSIQPESLVFRPVTAHFTTLAGGSLDATSAIVRIPTDDPGRLEADVRIDAEGLTISDLMIAAIPGHDLADAGAPGDPADGSADQPRLDGRSIAARLRPYGVAGGIATIQRPPGGPTAVRVSVAVDGGVRPPPLPGGEDGGGGSLEIGELTGAVNISREEVLVNLRGRPAGGLGWITTEVSVPIGEPGETTIRAEALALDVTAPIESLINVFRPAEARRLAAFKTAAHPEGLVDATLTLGAAVGGEPLRIDITNLVDPAMDLLGGRIGAPLLSGRLVIDQQAPGAIGLEQLRGEFTFDGEPLGLLELSGEYAIDPEQTRIMRIDYEDARIESPLIAAQIQRVGGDGPGSLWRDAAPAGLASGWLNMVTSMTEDGPQARVGALRIEPHTLSWTRNGVRGRPTQVSGVISGEAEGDGLGGVAEEIHLAGPRWEALAEGPWRLDAEHGLSATLALGGHLDPPAPDAPPDAPAPDLIPPGLRAALPEAAVEAIDTVRARADGRATLTDAVWRFRGGAPREAAPAFEGRLRLDSAAGGPGEVVQLEYAEAWISVQPAPGEGPPGLDAPLGPMEMLVSFEEGVIWGLPVTGGRAIVTSGAAPGLLHLPMVSADSAGGRITAHGEARRIGDNWTYNAQLISSGVPVSTIARAVRSGIGGVAPMAPDTPESTQGVLDLRFSVEGVLGDLRSRRGAGSLRISGGSPVNLPPALRLLVSTANARLAVAPYDHIEANFFLEGDVIAFPSFSMSSRDVVILGYGLMSLADGAVQLVATSAPLGAEPMGGELFRGVRDLFFTAYVGGSIDDPQALNLPPRDRLPAPLRQFLRQLQGGLTEREWLMRQLRDHSVGEPKPTHRRSK